MENILELPEGYILIPPVTGNSIYIAGFSTYTDYDEDPFLNELMRREKINDYAIASFKTLASSRIWPHEEEILTYRYLMLNQFPPENAIKGRAWLLDAQKLFKDRSQLEPRKEDRELVNQNKRNIGTQRLIYIHKGFPLKFNAPMRLEGLTTRIAKVGNPSDPLVGYLFKLNELRTAWNMESEDYVSRRVNALDISSQKEGTMVTFRFPQSLNLDPDLYYFIVYRTDKPSDAHFYQIDKNYLKMVRTN